jgi:hypothetical protein
MVDEARVENLPQKIVWLSSNCCDLTPAAPERHSAPVADDKAGQQTTPRSRLMGLLKRKPRTE